MALSPLASRYDRFLLDLDGCVWVGDAPTPRSPEAIAALRDGGAGICFLTNNPRHSEEDFVRTLWGMGVQASVSEIVTAAGALQHVLAGRYQGATAYVIGAPALLDRVSGAGLKVLNGSDLATRADVVVVAAHPGFDFDELRIATQAVMRGAALYGAGRDATGPMPDGPWPGSGAVLAAVEYATGTVAVTVGKPEPQLFLTALDRLGPGRALVVGDRLDSDLAGAHAAGLDAAIVLTGDTDRHAASAAADPAPVAIADTLADLVLE